MCQFYVKTFYIITIYIFYETFVCFFHSPFSKDNSFGFPPKTLPFNIEMQTFACRLFVTGFSITFLVFKDLRIVLNKIIIIMFAILCCLWIYLHALSSLLNSIVIFGIFYNFSHSHWFYSILLQLWRNNFIIIQIKSKENW